MSHYKPFATLKYDLIFPKMNKLHAKILKLYVPVELQLASCNLQQALRKIRTKRTVKIVNQR